MLRRFSIWVPLTLLASGCSNTFGPVVRDIHTDGNGRLLVDMCNVEVGHRASYTTMTDCTVKVVQVSPPTVPRSS
jgi:hypothetical protein